MHELHQQHKSKFYIGSLSPGGFYIIFQYYFTEKGDLDGETGFHFVCLFSAEKTFGNLWADYGDPVRRLSYNELDPAGLCKRDFEEFFIFAERVCLGEE